ncbi:hypothetical protein HA72_0949 [Metallosphaera sedula]|uniref:Uncharacterized protein n=3 Tax=Metallosphaera TaxID=41980 RepID=A4YFB9_METS5|nr:MULTISPECIES: hypothetical protein [Metallosphaera]ABP95121.1 hypothetical protein Msed_0949 [Metallosphaera sedula DSM 5348]AIM27107.1 hypothetical protein HA72_0949 [Metallosphaera sedula]AKV74015.1 hypothetical protein MsedA_0964 [Metallosphaera sedula]AKV76254.1 hypothetical protein MsedB_0965 [Metallosphaera sedula]AKV78507.1 hypothetical protein MsedC_0964 [Metallosphaera sedula]
MEIIKSAVGIIFVRPYPEELLNPIIEESRRSGVEISLEEDERVQKYIKSIIFSSEKDKCQESFDFFIRRLSLKSDLKEVVWAYQVECALKSKALRLGIPSSLPLVGNVLLSGLIFSNVKNMDLNQRKLCVVQFDDQIRVIKRDDKYFSVVDVVREAEKLEKVIEELGMISIKTINLSSIRL